MRLRMFGWREIWESAEKGKKGCGGFRAKSGKMLYSDTLEFEKFCEIVRLQCAYFLFFLLILKKKIKKKKKREI